MLLISSLRCGQYIDSEWTVGVGEPANAILSGRSDPEILIDQETNGGLRNYFLYVFTPSVFSGTSVPNPLRSSVLFVCSRSFQFGAECLGQHAGTHQVLDLGDGNGPSECHILCTRVPSDGGHFNSRERNCRDAIHLR